MNLEKAITAGELSRELGMSYSGALKLLKSMGGGKTLAGVTFYNRDDVANHLTQKYTLLLAFLECHRSSVEAEVRADA